MTFEEARGNLKDLELREFAYNHAAGMLYFDGVTAAPKGTYVSRGKTLSVLNEEIYKLSSSEAAHETLRVLSERMDELTEPERRIVELREKALRFRSRVPMDEYVAYQELLNESATVWREAKAKSDFALFQPVLEKIVAANRRFAALQLALTVMDESSTYMRSTIAPKLTEYASECFRTATVGKYDRLLLDTRMGMTVETPAQQSLDYLSSGTKDSAYLCLRLALLRLLLDFDELTLIHI